MLRLLLCAGLLAASPVFANLPGGGTNGANVTLTDNGSTVTLANGVISIVVTKADASIHTINYTYNNSGSTQTINVLGNGYSGGKFYWENSSDLGPAFTYAVVANPANTGGNYAEIALTASDAGNVSNIVMEAHFSLLRGNSGFYVTPIWIHRSTDGAFSMGECRDNIYSGSIFNWMSVDATRNKLMPVSGGTAIGVNSGPVEVSLWTSGLYAGQYEDKYKYTADYSTLRAWGWSSVGSGGKNVGLWDVAGSAEYMASGPMRRELICHMGTTILNTPHGGHYGFCSDSTNAPGEIWSKVCGPHFIYCNNITNNITVTNTAAQALYNDALAQSDAESGAWPYAWFTNSYYAPPSGRGTITGKIVIADTYNPNASASNLWVGVEQQPSQPTVTYDFQKWYKPYQFWVKTDANGNFTIPNVIAGTNYTLYAFGPGAAGTFQSQAQTGGSAPNQLDIPTPQFSVTVTAGATTNLGSKTWTPSRVGPTVFEIGYPDRTAGKFRHGEDWWVGDIGPSATAPSPVWSKFLEYPFDFPSGPTYTVGQSRWTTDWNFIQPIIINSTGAYDPWGNNSGTTSTIVFNLATAPVSNGSLYMATASSYQGPLKVNLNGTEIAGANGYDPSYDNSGGGSDASIRESNHGLFADTRLTVATGNLHVGKNTLTITMRKSGYLANHSMYDYLRLELPGYVPPAPASVRAYAGNTCNLICWPVQPGATSYNILRSTNSGSGYVSITNGVTGPVCGSGWNNATYLDTNVLNGTNYYYVVRSVNTVGSSTNSPEAGATPDATISASAPATPSDLSVGSVAHQSVTLNWSAVSNANFYTVYRSTLFNNGGGASNVLGTIVLANNVPNATYTDTSPTDGSIYRYAVAATGTGGTSTNSSGAVAVPKPSPPATPPASLYITSVINTNPAQDVSFTWNPVAGAIGYAIYRATSASGPFTFLQSVSTTTFFDGGLATNQIYYYRVAALNATGVSSYATDSINPKQAAPASLTANGSPTLPQVILSWPATPGATSYTVKRGTSIANETTTVINSYTGTSYTNSSLVNGTTYYYIVTATGANGTSGNSPEVSVTPGSSVWVSPVSGNWGDANNWSGGAIASGASSIADFSTLSLPGDLTVTLDSPRTVSALRFGDTSSTYKWILTGTNALTLTNNSSIKVANQSATISTPLAGTTGLTKNGAGTLVLGGATNTLTGGITNNAGSVTLDYSSAGSPATNILPAANNLVLNGGTIQIVGNSVGSTQTFASTTLPATTSGQSLITAAPVSGTIPTVNLGTLTGQAGPLVRFDGPAYNKGASSGTTLGGNTQSATAILNATAGYTGNGGILIYNHGTSMGTSAGAYATVGLYDWACISAGTSGTNVGGYLTGASQIAGFYTVTTSLPANTFGVNYDLTASSTLGANSGSSSTEVSSIRVNVNNAITITCGKAIADNSVAAMLITPNVGPNNITIAPGAFGFQVSRENSTTKGPASTFTAWQNNLLGELVINGVYTDSFLAGSGYVQGGPGTVLLSGANTYTGQSYLDGGYTVITADSGLGSPATGAAININGGTLLGNGTFTLDNAGANSRAVNLGSNGGGLATTAGNSMTVDGLIGSGANTGPLTIGIAASSANNNTAGLLPGTGPGTANTTPVYATGTVLLTNANFHTGGTVLQSGTLNINGINALGGANYGGLTFNGGTLQYVAGFTGNNGSADLTSVGTAGITLAAGGGTIDLNGNAVTYADSIGNGGSGTLLVKSSLAGGSLSLMGANQYLGSTTVTNATLFVNNTAGSATGAGDVTLQNNATLTGDGTVNGSVNIAAGGTLTPGGVFNSLSIGNDLTLAAGSTTRMQIQHSPLGNNVINISDTLTAGGALIITNVGIGAPALGDTFQLFNAANFTGTFASLTLPALATNLFWNTNLLATAGVISVVALTSPTISGIQVSDNNLILSGSGGPGSWPYLTLATTNLASGVWTPVATNLFDADGTFSVTNPIAPNQPQVFYKLQLQ
jgi:autotransporter-associated beta strand protein